MRATSGASPVLGTSHTTRALDRNRRVWFEPSLTKTFSDMATHYDTTVLPTRPRKPRDKGKFEGAVLIVERWILARLRNPLPGR